jgi:hypothetical protein
MENESGKILNFNLAREKKNKKMNHGVEFESGEAIIDTDFESKRRIMDVEKELEELKKEYHRIKLKFDMSDDNFSKKNLLRQEFLLKVNALEIKVGTLNSDLHPVLYDSSTGKGAGVVGRMMTKLIKIKKEIEEMKEGFWAASKE